MAKSDGKVIIDTELNTKGLSTGLSKFGKFAGGTLKATGVAIGAVTTAITAFGTKAVQTGMEFDSAMSQVAATLGKTNEEMLNEVVTVGDFTGNLRDFAKEMGSTTKYTATESAEALNYMALAGYDATKSVEMLPIVMNLASAGAMDLARASDMVTDTQTALGLSAEETAEMVDKMAMAASKSNTSVEQLGDAMLTIGGLGKEVAGGTTELTAALGILANAGIKGSEAGTKLRNVILKLSSPTKDGAAALEMLGVEAFDAEGNMRPLNETFNDLSVAMGNLSQQDRLQAISDIFNTRDVAAVSAMMAGMSTNIEGVSNALELAGVDAKKYNLDLQEIASDLKAGVYDGSEEFVKSMQNVFHMTAEEAQTLYDVMSASGSTFDALAANIDNAAGSAGKMADVQMGNLAGDVKILQSAFEGLQIAVSDKASGSLREFVQLGTDLITQITTGFKGNDSALLLAFENVLNQLIDKISSMLPKATELAAKLITALINGIQNSSGKLAEGATEIITTLANLILDEVPTLLTTGTDILLALIQGMVESGQGGGIASKFVTVIQKLVQYVIDNAPLFIQAGVELISQLATGLSENLPALIQMIPELVMSIVNGIIDNIDLLLDAALQIILALTEGLIIALPELVVKIPDIVIAIVKALLNAAPQLFEVAGELIGQLIAGIAAMIPKVIDKMLQLFNEIRNNKDKYKQKFLEIGKHCITGLLDGLKNGWNTIKDWISESVDGLVTTAKEKLGIHSPSKVFKQIGMYVVEGFDEGLEGFGDNKFADISKSINATLSTARANNSQARYSVENNNNFTIELTGNMDRLFTALIKENNHFITRTGNSGFRVQGA